MIDSASGLCPTHLYNAATPVGLLHALIGTDRNLHLFDCEKLVFIPGDLGLNVSETPSGKIACVSATIRASSTSCASLPELTQQRKNTAWVRVRDHLDFGRGETRQFQIRQRIKIGGWEGFVGAKRKLPNANEICKKTQGLGRM